VLRSVDRGPRRDGLCLCIDVDDLAVDTDVESEAVMQRRGRLEEQILLVFNHATDEVGQSTVRIRNVCPSFDDGDLGV
jgi:hypothetical protein